MARLIGGRRVNVEIAASDQTRAAVESAKRNVRGLESESQSLTGRMQASWIKVAAVMAGAAIAIRGIQRALGAIVAAGLDSERTWNDVAASLGRHNIQLQTGLPLVKQFADQMQTLTGISDELVGTAFQRLLDSNIAMGDSFKLTQAAMDLSVAKGMDLATTADLIGKSIDSSTNALSRYGITIDKSLPRQEQINQLLREVNSRFGGAAAARMDTTAGKIALLDQRFADFQESLFQVLQPSILAGLETLTDSLQRISDVTQALKPIPKDFLPVEFEQQVQAPGIHRAFEALWKWLAPSSPDRIDPRDITANSAAFQQMGRAIEDLFKPRVVEAAETFFSRMEAPLAALEGGKRFGQSFAEELQAQFDAETQGASNAYIVLAQLRAEYLRMVAEGRVRDLEAERLAWAEKVSIVQGSIGIMASLLNSFAQVEGKNRQTAFTGYKALAVAEAGIDAYKAYTAGLTMPGPIGWFDAAARFAAVLVRVRAIMSQRLTTAPAIPAGASGGGAIANPTSGAGAPGSTRTVQVTFHLHGATVVDRAAMDAFMRDALPSIERATADRMGA